MIYWIRAGDTDMVKVGRSTGPAVRLTLMQTSCPLELKLLREVNGGISDEIALHKYYHHKGLHILGEWYRLTDAEIRISLEEVLTAVKARPDLKRPAYIRKPFQEAEV